MVCVLSAFLVTAQPMETKAKKVAARDRQQDSGLPQASTFPDVL